MHCTSQDGRDRGRPGGHCLWTGSVCPPNSMGKPHPQEVGLWGCSLMRVEPYDGISAQRAVLSSRGAPLGPSHAGLALGFQPPGQEK